MDYLLSLVGQDENTIVDAIKDLAANAEKVKAQENEINEQNNELEKDKEELHYLRSKLDQKYDIIDDMENELDQIEMKLKETKNNLELKELDLNRLEMLITEQVEEINILRDNNLSMVSQIAENIQMEKKIGVQKDVIKELKGKLKNTNDMQSDADIDERDRLFREVESLKKENRDKEVVLESLETECSDLNQKLENLEREQTNSKEFPKNLYEELKQVDAVQKVESFECENCSVIVTTAQKMKKHMEKKPAKNSLKTNLKIKALETEKLLSQLKLDIVSKIFKIKEEETHDKNACKCKSFCRISHAKHNFQRSKSEEFERKYNHVTNVILITNSESVTVIPEADVGNDMVYECESCNEKFQTASDFIVHMECNHKKAAVMFLS